MLWLIYAALIVLAGSYVLIPLFKESKHSHDTGMLAETELDRLLDRKAVVYRNLKDLEFEHAMGRLSDGDFHQLEADYKNDAALLLQKLDQLGDSKSLDEAIEKETAARKAKRNASGSMPNKTVPRCPSCGAEIIVGKKYCADCGKQI